MLRPSTGCGMPSKNECVASAHPHAQRDDVESARRVAHHRGLFPARARCVGQARRSRLVWADCKALERRHNLGRGTLVVLDMLPESGTPSYEQRREMLQTIIPTDTVYSGDASRPVLCGAVVLTPMMRLDSHADALAFYKRLRKANRVFACDFFEGVVMKRADSIYPVQLRSATEECRGWVKHCFLSQCRKKDSSAP